ncbi:MAG: MFS transporter [Moorellaceae bacterium]
MEKERQERAFSYKAALMLTLAAMSWSLTNQMNSSMWSYFITDVALLTTSMLASILVVAKALEWAGAIVAGVIMEKVVLRWGKYGSWCLVAAPFVAFWFVIMFLNPSLPPAAKWIWYTVAYALLMFGAAFITAVQTTMVVLMGSRSREDRALLATKRAQGSQLGQLLFGLIGLPAILFINGGVRDRALGYAVVAIICGLIVILAYYLLYRNIPEGLDTKYTSKEEREAAAQRGTSGEKVGVAEMFVTLFKTPPLLGIIISDSMRILAQFTLLGIGMYIFTYIFKQPKMWATTLTAMGVFALLVTFIVEILIRFFNNRKLYIAGLFIFAIGLVSAYFMTNITAFIACLAISYFGAGLCNTNGTAMVGDAAIWAEWKHGKEMKAFMSAMGAMPPKFANLLSGVIIGYGLRAVGYVAKTEMSPATLNGIKMLGTILPAICLVFGAVCFLLLNRLTGEKIKAINEEVMARRAAKAAAAGEGAK